MNKIISNFVKFISGVFVGLAVLFLMFVTYPLVGSFFAERKARALCDEIKLGMSRQDMENIASKANADQHIETPNFISFQWKSPYVARWSCSIIFSDDGMIVDRWVDYKD